MTEKGDEAEELIYRGADKVYLIEDSIFCLPDEIKFKENIVPMIKERRPKIFLIGATKFGRSLSPRIAAAVETRLTADCVDLKIDEEGNFLQIRPAFTGNILARIETNRCPKIATVRSKNSLKLKEISIKKVKS